jgi:hypothetical protein
MLQLIEEKGKELGCTVAEATVVNWRTDIIPWYEKKGFEICGTQPFPDDERTTRPCFMQVMRKKI